MKGIILIALGTPYYAHMAYNLAVSIKYNLNKFGHNIPIAIIRSNDSLNQLRDRSIFDHEIIIDEELIKRNGKVEYLKAKTLLCDLSPFDETVFLDADMICLPSKDISELFNHDSLQIANRGEVANGNGLSQWVSIKMLYETYGIDHWYDLSSEYIYFTKKDKKFFDDVKIFYDDEQIPVVSFKDKHHNKVEGITEFNGGKPDEIPFGIAIEHNKIRFKTPYLPSYWQPQYFNKMKPDEAIKKEFYLLSCGGSFVQRNVKRIYDQLMKGYFSQMGLKGVPYQLIPKSSIITERKLI